MVRWRTIWSVLVVAISRDGWTWDPPHLLQNTFDALWSLATCGARVAAHLLSALTTVTVALGFALLPVSYSLQSRQRPQPNPRTLDEYTPHQYWSANFI